MLKVLHDTISLYCGIFRIEKNIQAIDKKLIKSTIKRKINI